VLVSKYHTGAGAAWPEKKIVFGLRFRFPKIILIAVGDIIIMVNYINYYYSI